MSDRLRRETLRVSSCSRCDTPRQKRPKHALAPLEKLITVMLFVGGVANDYVVAPTGVPSGASKGSCALTAQAMPFSTALWKSFSVR